MGGGGGGGGEEGRGGWEEGVDTEQHLDQVPPFIYTRTSLEFHQRKHHTNKIYK